MTVHQPLLNATEYAWISLLPRKADLVAVLNVNSHSVGYHDTVVLRADDSYDPDHVQVCKVIDALIYPSFTKLARSLFYALDCV